MVLIESDWNLKFDIPRESSALIEVLIESDWNLKLKKAFDKTAPKIVLIESDWNLKNTILCIISPHLNRINRIRLEFKAFPHLCSAYSSVVLIESDWNLKYLDGCHLRADAPY